MKVNNNQEEEEEEKVSVLAKQLLHLWIDREHVRAADHARDKRSKQFRSLSRLLVLLCILTWSYQVYLAPLLTTVVTEDVTVPSNNNTTSSWWSPWKPSLSFKWQDYLALPRNMVLGLYALVALLIVIACRLLGIPVEVLGVLFLLVLWQFRRTELLLLASSMAGEVALLYAVLVVGHNDRFLLTCAVAVAGCGTGWAIALLQQ